MRQPATILVVDDNPVVLFNAVQLLESAGYRTLQASSAQAALTAARNERPDLVLLDVVLPDAHGFDLCRQLKAESATRHSFVVLLSDKATSPEWQANGLDAGAEGYISRPVDNRELLARIQSMLRLQQAEAALRQARDELEQRVVERTAQLSEAHAHVRRVSQQLVDVQEAERREVACELHDEIGQWLTGLKIHLATALKSEGPVSKSRLTESIAMIDETLDRVRRLSMNLRPHVLDDLGLIHALDWHFQRFGSQTGIVVAFEHVPLPGRLHTRLETAAFRIAQEALTNVARHADVKAAAVNLWTDPGQLGLRIEDHGKGFDPASVLAARNSFGLAGMRERAEMLGGTMTVESKQGAGTRLTVNLPLHSRDDSPALAGALR